MSLFIAATVVAFAIELLTLSTVVPELRRVPSQRTPANLLCAGFATLFIVATLALLSWLALSVARA